MEISPYLLIPLITVVINQTFKLFDSASLRKLTFSKLLDFESQPYWFSALAWSLIPVTFFVDGVDSPWLATNIVLAIIISHQQKTTGVSYRKQLYTASIGFLSGVVLSANYWQEDFDWLLSRPLSDESRNYLIIFGVIVVVAEVLAYMTRRKNMRKLPTSRRLQRTFRISLLIPAIIGLFFAFLQNQTSNDFLTDRLYIYMMFAWIVIATISATDLVYRNARTRLQEEVEHFQQSKKQSKKKKKRKSRR
jgi:hypothetical protein